MPYATKYPAENASWAGLPFWEQVPRSKHTADSERVIVGQTVIGRYPRPTSVQIEAICGASEEGDLRDGVGYADTLVWSGGSDTAYLDSMDSSYEEAFGVYVVRLAFLL